MLLCYLLLGIELLLIICYTAYKHGEQNGIARIKEPKQLIIELGKQGNQEEVEKFFTEWDRLNKSDVKHKKLRQRMFIRI